MTETEAEAFVRKHWERAYVRFPTHSYANETWEYQLGSITKDGFRTPDEAWLAAAAFTEQRREEIRQVEREIEVLLPRFGKEDDWRAWAQNGWSKPLHTAASVREHHAWARILASEQATLDALRQGMKEASDE
jgi:hypothetical protein